MNGNTEQIKVRERFNSSWLRRSKSCDTLSSSANCLISIRFRSGHIVHRCDIRVASIRSFAYLAGRQVSPVVGEQSHRPTIHGESKTHVSARDRQHTCGNAGDAATVHPQSRRRRGHRRVPACAAAAHGGGRRPAPGGVVEARTWLHGNILPELAESWTISHTDDGAAIQADFVLPQDWDDGSIGIEGIQQALQQVADQNPCHDCKGLPGGNPCIIPTPVGISPKGPFKISAAIVDDHTIRIAMPRAACTADDATCEQNLLDTVAGIRLFDPDLLTYVANKDTGNNLFEIDSVDGATGLMEYNPETGEAEFCPDCELDSPASRPICTPVPNHRDQMREALVGEFMPCPSNPTNKFSPAPP